MLDIDRGHFWGTFTASVGEGMDVSYGKMTGMTATTIRQLLADVVEDQGHNSLGYKECLEIAQALLASPELADIIDLAAWIGNDQPTDEEAYEECPQQSPEVRALLADWRSHR